MMNKYTLPVAWRHPAATLAAVALAAGPILAHGQFKAVPAQSQAAPLTLLLSGPQGEHSTLVRAADGWRVQPGWNLKTEAGSASRLMPVAMPMAPAPPGDVPVQVRPLTVFLDGPTGFAFIYVADEGWKFAGTMVDPAR